MVTFETKAYENDYCYLLNGNRLDKMIGRNSYNFFNKELV